MSFTYEYPRGALTVDCVVFGFDGGALKILLIQRGIEPFQGDWALPGGFVHLDESLEAAAMRELKEETGLENVFLEQLFTFGEPNRDPRERVVSVAYFALVRPENYTTQAQTDADDARWFLLSEIPKLAFDHDTILTTALNRLRGKLRYEPIGFELLPEKFTLPQLQELYESVLGTELDKRNFRKKVLSYGLLIPLDEKRRDGPHRPAQLYRFEPERYEELRSEGFLFEI